MALMLLLWARLAAAQTSECDADAGDIDLGVIYDEITDESGVRAYANGLGANINDFDGDGDYDIMANQGPSRAEEAVYYNGESLLFLNNGDMTFEEVGGAWGVDDLCEDRAPYLGDLDNDGLPDMYVTVNGRNLVYKNIGGGFTDVTAFAGAADHPGWSHQGFMLDYDRDGYLDVFFTNGPEDGSGFNALLHNEGDFTFRDVSVEAGIAGDPSGKGSCVLDVNLDGWMDMFVATGREFGNHLFINQKDGTFLDQAFEWGVSDPFQRFGIGPSCEDFDNDGDPDIFLVTHDKWWSGNNLFVNEGDHFVDRTAEAGLLEYLDGHGNAPVDIDNDGLFDLVLSGIGTPPYVLLNNGDLTWSKVCFGGGIYQADGLTWSVVPGDMTGDGYPEVLITNGLGRRPAANRLFQARGEFGNSWIQVEVKGVTHNPSQIGAKIEVEAGDQTMTRWVGAYTSFDSQGPLPVVIGMGTAEEADLVRVTFTNGAVVELTGVAAGEKIVVSEPSDWQDADFDGVADAWDACPDTERNHPTDGEGCAPTDRAGVAVGLVAPIIGDVVAAPPVFEWTTDAEMSVVQVGVDGTFSAAGRFDFGPIRGTSYALTEEEWASVTSVIDGTKPLIWRVVAVSGRAQGLSGPRSFYGAVPKSEVYVPEGANGFRPAHIVVDAGTTVSFTNDAVEAGNLQNEPHDVQLLGPDGKIVSSKIDLEGSSAWTYVFDLPGRYNFICHRHSGIGHHTDAAVESDMHTHGHTTQPFHCMSGTVTVR